MFRIDRKFKLNIYIRDMTVRRFYFWVSLSVGRLMVTYVIRCHNSGCFYVN